MNQLMGLFTWRHELLWTSSRRLILRHSSTHLHGVSILPKCADKHFLSWVNKYPQLNHFHAKFFLYPWNKKPRHGVETTLIPHENRYLLTELTSRKFWPSQRFPWWLVAPVRWKSSLHINRPLHARVSVQLESCVIVGFLCFASFKLRETKGEVQLQCPHITVIWELKKQFQIGLDTSKKRKVILCLPFICRSNEKQSSSIIQNTWKQLNFL